MTGSANWPKAWSQNFERIWAKPWLFREMSRWILIKFIRNMILDHFGGMDCQLWIKFINYQFSPKWSRIRFLMNLTKIYRLISTLHPPSRSRISSNSLQILASIFGPDGHPLEGTLKWHRRRAAAHVQSSQPFHLLSTASMCPCHRGHGKGFQLRRK